MSALVILSSCSEPGLDYQVETIVNPYRISPLTAVINIETKVPCRASVKILGDYEVEYTVDEFKQKFSMPVIGLYPDYTNKVLLTLESEKSRITDTIEIVSNPLPKYFPEIHINKIDRSEMEPGLHLCDIHFAQNGIFYSRPMLFDDQGQVRWYLDLSFFKGIIWPIQRLKDGVLLVAGRNEIFEYDMLGQQLKHSLISDNYRIHHDIVELPNGNLLMPVKRFDSQIQIDGKTIPSFNDFIILYDRETSSVIKEWDMAKHLDVSRKDMNLMTESDWLHMNGLAFSPHDSCIIVSGKNQGLFKITWDDELKWIMAPKVNWGRSGRNDDGFDTNPYLLTAVDANGKPYNEDIQKGIVSAVDFDFPWGQHAPRLLDNGNILLFDNGYTRYFKEEASYSRAVEYRVDEEKMTVEQIWQYGKERGKPFYSMLISEADHLKTTGNVLATFGFVLPHNAKIVEVNYPEGEEVFEATLDFKTLNGNKTFNWGQLDVLYRSERFELKY